MPIFDLTHWQHEAQRCNGFAQALVAIWERLDEIDARLNALETADEPTGQAAREIIAELGAGWRIEREERQP
jgi:hypothetical protein